MKEGSYTLYSKACEVVYKASYLSFRDCETYTLRISCLIYRGANGATPQQGFSKNSFFFMKEFENTTKYSNILHQTIEYLAKNFSVCILSVISGYFGILEQKSFSISCMAHSRLPH